jgi:hypothetical protein
MEEITREKIIEIGKKAGTDKIAHHGYDRFYHRHLRILKEKNDFSIIEIGFGDGSSVKFWRELFPKSFLYCFDRDVTISGSGFSVLKCDQSDASALKRSADKISRPVHLIIDDGSHLPTHQISTFNYLFKNVLQDGGIYIIEDIETSYWRYFDVYGYKTRYGIYHPKSSIEIFKKTIDLINAEYLSKRQNKQLRRKISLTGMDLSAADLISEISFGQNCVVIHKKTSEDAKYESRAYGLASRVSSIHALEEFWKMFKNKFIYRN